ncbi:ferrous iron transport protein A [bacterium]|nr:ferrous iron transport protein A [bacterium]
MESVMKLSECRSGDIVLITEIDSHVSGTLRLRELGVLEGVDLKVIKSSNPMLLHVNESRIALDRELAAAISVNYMVSASGNQTC